MRTMTDVAALLAVTPPDMLASDGFSGTAAALNGQSLDAVDGGATGLTWVSSAALATTGSGGTPANAIQRTAATTVAATVSSALAPTDVLVTAVVAALPTGTSVIGPICRAQSTGVTPQCYGIRVGTTGALTLFSINSSAGLSALSSLSGTNVQVGDRIGLRVSGTTIQAILNYTVLASVTDGTTTVAGLAGVRLGGGDTSGVLTSFRVEAA